MKKKTIADTPFGVALDLKAQSIDAAKFMVKHPSIVLDEDVFNAIKSSVKMTVSSAFADIYSKATEIDDWTQWFTLIDLSDADESVPTIFTLDDITVDGKFVTDNMPKAYQNAWINLTPILGKRVGSDAYNSFLPIKDAPRLAALISRGILCMSYNDSDDWLSSSEAEFMMSAYAFIFTFQFGSMFNLDAESNKLFKTLLCAYMAQMLGGKNDPKDFPPLLNHCKFLGSVREIKDRLEPMAEKRQEFAKAAGLDDVNTLTLDIVCKLFAEFGPDRMKKFSESNMVRYMSRSAMERNATIMSLYYPPYFLYMLMAAASGTKNPVFMSLTKYGDMKRDLQKFVSGVTHSSFLMESIKR